MMQSAILIQYTRVTDGRRDEIGVAYTCYSIYAVAHNKIVLCDVPAEKITFQGNSKI